MKELSIFIDESGDFGSYDPKSPFYIVSIVLHDQRNDISKQIKALDVALGYTELKRDFVHTGPLIRKEKEYKHMDAEKRLGILKKLIKFSTQVEFSHKSVYVEKKHIEDENEIVAKLARQLSDFIRQHYIYFTDFDKIKIYYDNGQSGVMKIILSVFIAMFRSAEFKKSEQHDYKMLQVADLICTKTLTELKMERKTLTRSERRVLGTDRDINKILLKPLARKEFKG